MKIKGLLAIYLMLCCAPGFGQAYSSNGQVQGPAANGANAVGNPVQIGGVDPATGKIHPIKIDSTGGVICVGGGGGGGGGSVYITDSTLAHNMGVDAAGQIGLNNWPSYATAAAQTAGNSTLLSILTAISSPAQDATLTGGGAKFQTVDGSGNTLGTPTHPVRTDPTGTTPQPVVVNSGSVTCNAGTSLNTSLLATSGNQTNVQSSPGVSAGSANGVQGVTGGIAVKVDGSAVTQPISGNVGITGSVAVTGTFWPYTLGQAVMGSSVPVVIASNQSALGVTGTFWQATQPVSIATLPALTTSSAVIGHVIVDSSALPTGAALDATLTGGTAKTQIFDGSNVIGTSAHPVRTDPTGSTTQPVSGTVGITGSVAVTGSFYPALGQALMAASLPIVFASNQSALAVTGTFWQATQPVSGTVALGAGSAVIGHVIVDSGSITAANPSVSTTGTAVPVSATMIGVTDGTNLRAMSGDSSGRPTVNINGTVPVSGPIAISAGSAVIGHVIADTGSTTAVTGTVTVGTHAVTQSGTWSSQITDGTTTANVGPSSGAQTGQTYLQTGGTYQPQTLTATTASTSSVFDVRGYRWVCLQQTATYTGETNVSWQSAGNSSSTFAVFPLYTGAAVSGSTTSNSTNTYCGPLNAPYFELVWTGTGSSGTSSVSVTFYTMPSAFVGSAQPVSQNGTWTVQPGNTANTTAWLVNAGLNPTTTALNTYSVHLTSNATTTPTASTAYISSITISSEAAGTTSTVTIQDKQGTPLKLVNGLSTTAITTAPTTINFQTPVKMVSGIDLVTAGAVAATIDVWINYYQ